MKFHKTFELSEYCLSHKRLVLISKDDDELEELIEFESVFFIQIPSTVSNFTLSLGEDKDRKYIEKENNNSYFYWKLQRVYILETKDGNKYYIGAGGLNHKKIKGKKQIYFANYTTVVNNG